MEETAKAVRASVETILGAVFDHVPLQAYSQAVQLIAELDRRGYRIEEK